MDADSFIDHIDKKAGHKKCVIKWETKFQDCKECLEENKAIVELQIKFRSETQKVFTEKVNQISLSANDDKRIQTPEEVISYPYNTGLRRVCKEELLKQSKTKNKI